MLGSRKLVAFIGVSNAASARAFYGDTLGLKLVEESSFALVFDVQGTMLRVTFVGKVAPHGYTVLGWDVPDILATVTELRRAGVQMKHYDGMGQDEHGIWTSPGGSKIAWFADPDGNTLSVTEFIEAAQE